MNDKLYEAMHPDYEKLPEALKVVYTPREYMWLGDEERSRAIERETQPDMDYSE